MHYVKGKIVLLLVCILTSICFVSYFRLWVTQLKHAVKLSEKNISTVEEGTKFIKKVIFNPWTKKIVLAYLKSDIL